MNRVALKAVQPPSTRRPESAGHGYLPDRPNPWDRSRREMMRAASCILLLLVLGCSSAPGPGGKTMDWNGDRFLCGSREARSVCLSSVRAGCAVRFVEEGSIPAEAGERIVVRFSFGEEETVRGPADLAGCVRIASAAEALEYLRLFLVPLDGPPLRAPAARSLSRPLRQPGLPVDLSVSARLAEAGARRAAGQPPGRRRLRGDADRRQAGTAALDAHALPLQRTRGTGRNRRDPLRRGDPLYAGGSRGIVVSDVPLGRQPYGSPAVAVAPLFG